MANELTLEELSRSTGEPVERLGQWRSLGLIGAEDGERFLGRIYTAVEVAFCRGRVHELAARFAAKEAVMKALGTGARGVAWREIEVLPNHRGKPLVYLYGRAKAGPGSSRKCRT